MNASDLGLAAAALDWGEFRHVAVCVDDFDRATKELEALGCPLIVSSKDATRRYKSLEHGVQDISMTIGWTILGELIIEVIRGVPGTLFEPKGPAYLHHVTFAIDDVAAEREKWEARGYPVILQWDGPNPGFSWFRLFGGVLACFISTQREYPAAALRSQAGAAAS
jgi:hypothetical protein